MQHHLFVAVAVAAAPIAVLAPIGLLTAGITSVAVNSTAVPAPYRELVTQAATTCPELTIELLAAQLDTESNWDPTAVSPAGAQGIAQFMPNTWTTWGTDANTDGHTNPFDPADAIASQARYLCHLITWATTSGLPDNPIELALAAYNAGPGAVEQYHGIPPYPETTHYITAILTKMARYKAATPTPTGDGRWDAWTPPPDGLNIGDYGYPPHLSPVRNETAATAIRFALTQIGKPYKFGAHGPASWDCSGLIQAAYHHAGITIGGWTGTQQHDGYRISTITDIEPGDLIFIPGTYGTRNDPRHVGLYLGDGLILQAPQTGDHVRITPLTNWMALFSFAQRIT